MGTSLADSTIPTAQNPGTSPWNQPSGRSLGVPASRASSARVTAEGRVRRGTRNSWVTQVFVREARRVGENRADPVAEGHPACSGNLSRGHAALPRPMRHLLLEAPPAAERSTLRQATSAVLKAGLATLTPLAVKIGPFPVVFGSGRFTP